MANFWLVLIAADGKPKTGFMRYLGHDATGYNADSECLEGLTELGPLKAEHIMNPKVVDGPNCWASAPPNVEFSVGDRFIRVDDDGYRKLFGEDWYKIQTILIKDADALHARHMEMQPTKRLEAKDLPAVTCPDDASDELRTDVGLWLENDDVLSTTTAVMRIDKKFQGYAAAWCGTLTSEQVEGLHYYIFGRLASCIENLEEGLANKKAGQAHGTFDRSMAHYKADAEELFGLAKMLPSDDDQYRLLSIAYGRIVTEIDGLTATM